MKSEGTVYFVCLLAYVAAATLALGSAGCSDTSEGATDAGQRDQALESMVDSGEDLARRDGGSDVHGDGAGLDLASDGATPDAKPVDPPWAVSGGGLKAESGEAIAVDSLGNLYVAGTFHGSASFGTIQLTSKGQVELFVIKLDGKGKVLWAATSAGGPGMRVEARGVAVDGAGNVYVAGTFDHSTSTGAVSFGAHALTSREDEGVPLMTGYLARLDSAGTWSWALDVGGSEQDIMGGVAVSAAGQITLIGTYMGTASFGGKALSSGGDVSTFVARLDSAGKGLWAATSSGWNAWGKAVAVDGAGNAHVTGSFNYKVTFGAHTLQAAGSSSYGDLFAARLDGAGTWVWASAGGGVHGDIGHGVAVDSAGKTIIVAGLCNGPATFGTHVVSDVNAMCVARLDSQGKWLWARGTSQTSPGANNAVGYGVAMDKAGQVHVTGMYRGTVTFGAVALTVPSSSWNVFAARLDSAGTWKGARSAAGKSNARGNAIAAISGRSYATGTFAGTSSFGATTLTSKGSNDVFVWRPW